MFLSVKINLEVIKIEAQNCSLKKNLSKILKHLQENTFAEKTKRERKETLAQVFLRELC